MLVPWFLDNKQTISLCVSARSALSDSPNGPSPLCLGSLRPQGSVPQAGQASSIPLGPNGPSASVLRSFRTVCISAAAARSFSSTIMQSPHGPSALALNAAVTVKLAAAQPDGFLGRVPRNPNGPGPKYFQMPCLALPCRALPYSASHIVTYVFSESNFDLQIKT